MAPMKSQGEILGLIEGRRSRRPARDLPFLDALFRQLQSCHKEEAERTEDQIWSVWMDHPHAVAARVLDLATRDIAARRYDIAETRLTQLLRRAPDFAEAWHKRATLYYLIGRTLELEPRHFAAMMHFGEILLGAGAPIEARFAFYAALTIHPHLPRARAALADKA
jgi:tetratricopeptide (TPR) repeat protein